MVLGSLVPILAHIIDIGPYFLCRAGICHFRRWCACDGRALPFFPLNAVAVAFARCFHPSRQAARFISFPVGARHRSRHVQTRLSLKEEDRFLFS